MLGAPGVGYYDNGASYVIYGADMPPKESSGGLTEAEKNLIIGLSVGLGVPIIVLSVLMGYSYCHQQTLGTTVGGILEFLGLNAAPAGGAPLID